jgi:hypothetical protein
VRFKGELPCSHHRTSCARHAASFLRASALNRGERFVGELPRSRHCTSRARPTLTLLIAARPRPQISSYSFVFPFSLGLVGRYLLPLLDLMNHDGVAPNVDVRKDVEAGVYRATALRAIGQGEQIMHRCAAARRSACASRCGRSHCCSRYCIRGICATRTAGRDARPKQA